MSNHVRQIADGLANKLRLRQSFRIVQSTLVPAPVVVGWIKPLILLPVGVISGLSEAQLQAVIAHELAHVRRHDYLVNILQTVIEAAFFYHPAVWWLSGRIRAERELCCDDIAIGALESRSNYGRALLAVAELKGNQGLLALGVTDGSLLHRVKRLFGSTTVERSPLATALSVSVLVVSVTAGVAALAWYQQLQPRENADSSEVVAAEPELMTDDEMQVWQQIFSTEAHLNGSSFHNRSLYQHAKFS